MTAVYVARLNYKTTTGGSKSQITVGVFSSKRLAEVAIENFVEGVLNIEYSDASVVGEVIEEFRLDVPVNEDGADLNMDEVPF